MKGTVKGNTKGNANGKGKARKRRKGDESDENQNPKRKQMCFYCNKEGHMIWNSLRMKHRDPPVTKGSTEMAVKAKNDTITAATDSADMTTSIENCWMTDAGGK